MIDKDRIVPFVALGEYITSLLEKDDKDFFRAIQNQNNWFTEESVKLGLKGVQQYLSEEALVGWTNAYDWPATVAPKNVGIVMAGNIPLVGFHDLLCVIVAGHNAWVKPSSQDSLLMMHLIEQLKRISPELGEKIQLVERLNDADAVIATGSDNSARYFSYYFGKKPNIIRQNRTSVAVLTGKETQEDIVGLGKDIFTYYGLGCRNVSKVFVPQGFDFTPLLDGLSGYESVGDHHKYRNNYDYNKSIYLVNKEPHLDTGFLLVRESEELVSPISVLYYQQYTSAADLSTLLENSKDKIQCVVGEGYLPFGSAQHPEVDDYADGVDTFKFLIGLS